MLTVMIPVEDVSAESRYVSIVLIVLAVLVLSAVVFCRDHAVEFLRAA